jgi:hypothetical protein
MCYSTDDSEMKQCFGDGDPTRVHEIWGYKSNPSGSGLGLAESF